MTVSNAYNHPDRLSDGLRERIFETAGRLGYGGPDPVGRSLKRQRTDVVGVLYSSPLSYAFDDIPAAASADPPLTTIHQDHAEKGVLAGRMLVSRLRKDDPPSDGPLATHLVVRDSTSPPQER
jgi:DNA-binding LacI/PurR family transcriptional regulator